MGRFLRFLYYKLTFRWSKAAEVWLEEEAVISAVFDRNIEKGQESIDAGINHLSELNVLKTELTQKIKVTGANEEKFEGILQTIQAALQARINLLRSQGKSKEEIQADAEYLQHEAKFAEAEQKFKDASEELDRHEADLAALEKQRTRLKSDLEKIKRKQDELRNKKGAVISDNKMAKQRERLNAALAGFSGSNDTDTKDLEAVMEAHKKVVARAAVIEDMADVNAGADFAEYEGMAPARVRSKLDAMLDFGDTAPAVTETKATETLEPSRLPEP